MATAPDLTPTAAREALNAFAETIGPRAEITAWLKTGAWNSKTPLYAVLKPLGYSSDRGKVHAEANTFSDLVEAIKAAWVTERIAARQRTVIEMAIAIISITAATGACTDAALRVEFSGQDIEDCGAEACVKADEIAGRGPFRIVKGDLANAPDDLDEKAA